VTEVGARSSYGHALAALAVLLLANAALGPAGLGRLSYPLPTSLLNQLRGLELVTVLLVVPTLALAVGLVRRGRPEAALVAIGPCGYASYMFVQYVVGPERTAASPALLLHLVVFALATALAVWSWSLAVAVAWPVPERGRRRRWGLLLLGLAGFVALRYVPVLAGAVTGARIPDEFAGDPAFYWSILLLDLGLVVPAATAAGVAVLRGSRLSVPAAYAVVGWFALVPPSVAAMAIVMLVRDDPYASLATTLLLTATSVVTTAAAVLMFRGLLRRRSLPHQAEVRALAVGPTRSGPSARRRRPSGSDRPAADPRT
jgi:hypothetical protein